jgi:hypothetical protein
VTDPWDDMISGDDAEVEAEITADAAAYTKALIAGDERAGLKIESKYGLVGLTPEMVSQTLAEMAKPTGESE